MYSVVDSNGKPLVIHDYDVNAGCPFHAISVNKAKDAATEAHRAYKGQWRVVDDRTGKVVFSVG